MSDSRPEDESSHETAPREPVPHTAPRNTERANVETEPLPARPRAWQLLTAFHSTGPRWPGSLRAALALTIPGLIALTFGLENEMLLIAAGGFTVIYGEGHPFRARWRIMLTAGLLIAAGATTGAFVGTFVWQNIDAGGSHWWLMLAAVYTSLIATGGGFIQNALRLNPPGSFFIVMVSGGSTVVARLGLNPVEVGAWALVGVASGVIIGMAPALLNARRPQEQAVGTLEKAVADFENAPQPAVAKNHQAKTALANAWASLADAGVLRDGRVIDHRQEDLVRRTTAAHHRLVNASVMLPNDGTVEELTDTPNYIDLSRTSIPHARPTIAYRLYRSMHPYSHASLTAGRILVATLLASTVGIAFGLDRPDWAIVSALLILQWGPDRVPGTIRGLHRLVGSVAGIGLFAVFHLLQVEGVTLLLALAVCQFFAEFFVVRNYAFAVIFTTPLALLMGNSIADPLGDVVVSRSLEVALSIIFGILLLWVWFANSEPRHHARLVQRSFDAMGSLLGALMVTSPADALTERRDLQYELLSERRAAHSLANNHPELAKKRWETHLAVQMAGYGLLDSAAAHPGRPMTPEEIVVLAGRVRAAAEYR
ncbi:FUSC family protein [Corynebacterium halotolerans]|uniref:Integral membrane bound transporter domain-containing protein n=1 Tax=Corynebacterium halotolerans YIM 70093 = DSM 44683 TaxID=1121362 RepID=M1MZK5_9CORY|nr:FUSC family protein [Corynebacterium halotolerans]AGF73144.1 hypothetical protein A605_10720 [Corynebacterium halotolerans YIM 70093 = DSM 44683]